MRLKIVISLAQAKTFRMVVYNVFNTELKCVTDIIEANNITDVWKYVDVSGRPDVVVNGDMIEYSGKDTFMNELCSKLLRST